MSDPLPARLREILSAEGISNEDAAFVDELFIALRADLDRVTAKKREAIDWYQNALRDLKRAMATDKDSLTVAEADLARATAELEQVKNAEWNHGYSAGLKRGRAEGDRLRAALESAPEPEAIEAFDVGQTGVAWTGDEAYKEWYDTTRREALK